MCYPYQFQCYILFETRITQVFGKLFLSLILRLAKLTMSARAFPITLCLSSVHLSVRPSVRLFFKTRYNGEVSVLCYTSACKLWHCPWTVLFCLLLLGIHGKVNASPLHFLQKVWCEINFLVLLYLKRTRFRHFLRFDKISMNFLQLLRSVPT